MDTGTPPLARVINKGTFKAYNPYTQELTVTVQRFDPDEGTKVNLDINYNVSTLTDRLITIEAEITALRKEKVQTTALLDKFATQVTEARTAYLAEQAKIEADRVQNNTEE